MMGDRHSQFSTRFVRSRSGLSGQKSLPGWVFLSLFANGVLLALMALFIQRLYQPSLPSSLSRASAQAGSLVVARTPIPQLGPRHQLTYSQWINLLGQEARVAAEQAPHRLSILAGDSLSLWFPEQLLMHDRTWLNQGISGETSTGLLKRLSLFDQTQPETIFVMIGINDLIRGVADEEILRNYKSLIRYLKAHHPKTQIVVQSILPHAAEQSTWEGRDRLLAIPNQRIRILNRNLQAIVAQEQVHFLDLYPLFADARGNLKMEFSTDGLHLSTQGYLVWRTALDLYSGMKLES